MKEVLLIVGAGFAAVFATGYWLKKQGRPYRALPLTLHKLLGVGILIYLIVTVVHLNRAAALGGLEWGLCLAAGALFLAALASGGWLSSVKEEPKLGLTLHRLLPRLVVIATLAFVYLLARR
jgi:succinate dehydrogenase/fumarate reductase cytochrome b subunit